jgi:hypothetical protein
MKRFKYVVNTNIFRNIKTSAEIVGVDGIEWGLKTLDSAWADVRKSK